MTEKDFLTSEYGSLKNTGKVRWKSPSNIALVKYWGKKKNQVPANPSLSFTLDVCATDTTISYHKLDKRTTGFSFDLLFEGKLKSDFRPKIETFFNRIDSYLPFLRVYHFKIETSNSFPHSSGIASSASGMSALALCLMSMERELVSEMDTKFFNKKASFLARLGSGSACRSIEGPLVQWGNHSTIEGSSDFYGIEYPYKIHEIFRNFQDTILLVDEGQKQISSSVGHDLMHGHPFAEQRFGQGHSHLSDFRSILADGNLDKFIKIVESEALTLHAMMMTSHPYFILMKPNTLEIINRIWSFRETSKAKVCFTLDAGANVHVLYPEQEKETVYEFIKNELLHFCKDEKHICDRTGLGSKNLSKITGT
ncbi:diphosphomevalonate decarboxylase [Pricia antarctica]|uniref:Diphosphomevalonate decarboxylase n=1 Tax=Pricia antarctica TaxID=641691 RepID=A0A1G6VU05_9FLAO|nr:diphosphomevalonate decarboxylase [Pricia antarctica]SDD57014.1 diphosphomevalonate decarboxylase [Pricia antarctica]